MKDSCDSGNLIKSHAIWKTKLAIAIANDEWFDIDTISQKDFCIIGKWLHNESNHSRYGHLQSYLDCVKKHAKFHIEAGKIAEMANAKQQSDALLLLNDNASAFNVASDEITLAMFNFLHDLNNLNEL